MFGKKDDVIFLLISSIQHFTLGAQTALHGRFSCSALHYAHANAIKKKKVTACFRIWHLWITFKQNACRKCMKLDTWCPVQP